jgi:hypothetical protein
MQMADDVKYTSYKPYANYEPYSAAVEALTAKMNMQKRHKLIFEPTDSMIAENDNMKRSVMHIDECLTKDNNMKRNMMHAEADENIPTSTFSRNPRTARKYPGFKSNMQANRLFLQTHEPR